LARLAAGLSKEELTTVFETIRGDAGGTNGAARLLLGSGKWRIVDRQVLEEYLEPLAMRGLGHPRAVSRTLALTALGEIKGPKTVQLLCRVLTSDISIEELPEGKKSEPYGIARIDGRSYPLDEKVSDQAYAALLLAKQKNRDCLPRIQHLAETATGEEWKVLQQALKLLEQSR
ncbi:MAG: hypothetical protein RDV41_11175, partial [Planctomycetota bacterium]|nr:hypothetical protein [Planctomycetota bacterium]